MWWKWCNRRFSPTNMHNVRSKTDDWLQFTKFSSFPKRIHFKRSRTRTRITKSPIQTRLSHPSNDNTVNESGNTAHIANRDEHRSERESENGEPFMLIAISHWINMSLWQTLTFTQFRLKPKAVDFMDTQYAYRGGHEYACTHTMSLDSLRSLQHWHCHGLYVRRLHSTPAA